MTFLIGSQHNGHPARQTILLADLVFDLRLFENSSALSQAYCENCITGLSPKNKKHFKTYKLNSDINIQGTIKKTKK